MEFKAFQELSEKISYECFFMTDNQQEEKIIQLIDLHHFIESFGEPLIIISYLNSSVNIVEERGIRKGILFYDMKYSSLIHPKELIEFKVQNNLDELWFVIVEERFNMNFNLYSEFIFDNDIKIFYDKLFVFNFFQSVITPLS